MSRSSVELIPYRPSSSATEIEGTFRVNGSNKRMRELQAIFETPPRVRVFPHTPAPYTHRYCGTVRQVTRLES